MQLENLALREQLEEAKIEVDQAKALTMKLQSEKMQWTQRQGDLGSTDENFDRMSDEAEIPIWFDNLQLAVHILADVDLFKEFMMIN